jgi:hypothetical protein
MSTFAEGDRVFSNAHLDNEPGTVTQVEVEQGVELVSVTWADDAGTYDTTREVATDLYLDDYGDDELAVDRAWAGNVDYDDLADQADEKMSPPWVDDGYGMG